MSRLAHLRDVLGFDETKHIPGTRMYRIRCSACDALVVSGIAAHEIGCPNRARECFECGCLIPAGERCTCMDPIEEDELCD